ncbi:hypothetical protein RDI58_022615 [Solanum bulbocastanum]|uniref:Uncharacterized protein n=1 Tax=Solanum bulbocastanum TaxID=147425 RepID=A0AAN8Y6A4_SOLBU
MSSSSSLFPISDIDRIVFREIFAATRSKEVEISVESVKKVKWSTRRANGNIEPKELPKVMLGGQVRPVDRSCTWDWNGGGSCSISTDDLFEIGEGSQKQIPQHRDEIKATTRRLQGWLERNCQSATMKRDSGNVQSYMSNICLLSIFLIEGMMKTKPSPATGKYQRCMVSMMESE